ncbi:levansucrase [Streptomyces sp. SID13666]|uniref:levansucrase n=1 Tax=Streptomyces TaxID=1883 RepID=UPI001106BBEF|nr:MULTISPECIES: levansucrase [unclassified Streptomyces]NEA53761.1 levansucrase [Streptomyces sp. SID13666]NEA71539.1 levansucrase [Streptomyces sp. SID13588]QNA76901.1 levansucrase [Streptomyces sp. So13.3]
MSEESPRNYLAAVESRLTADGCNPQWQDWSGVRVLVGRRSDFRLRWMATNLHVFTIAAAVPEITAATIDTFTTQTLSFAKKNKGGLPVGMQTGVAVFPVLVSERVDPAAMAWAEEKQRNQFACFARPVVVDTARHYVGLFRGKPALGWIYSSHLIEKGDRYFNHPA